MATRYPTNRFCAAVILCSTLLFSSPFVLAEFERGQQLYENHCRLCHESWVHTRATSRITSVSSLRQRVAAWNIHSGLDWGEEEIHDVTDYLNRHYYQLESRQ